MPAGAHLAARRHERQRVHREGVDDPIEFAIVRDIIEVESVRYALKFLCYAPIIRR